MGLCRSCKNFVKIVADVTFIFFIRNVTVNFDIYCTFTPYNKEGEAWMPDTSGSQILRSAKI